MDSGKRAAVEQFREYNSIKIGGSEDIDQAECIKSHSRPSSTMISYFR